MKFTRLRIVNFLTIGDSGDLSLADRGLNLIQGVNDDDPSASSNGAGKSSIPDALCWALYGTTARGESGDAVINDTAKKGTMVQVTIQDGSSIYTATRYRKHATGKNSLTLVFEDAGSSVPLTKGTDRETQAELERVLGCSYEVFTAAIYAGQEKMPDLPKMTDKELKTLIEQAAGVSRLERAYEIARGQLLEAERECKGTITALESSAALLNAAKVRHEGAKIRHKEFEDAREGKAVGYDVQAANLTAEGMTILTGLQGLDIPAIVARQAVCNAELGTIQAVQSEADRFAQQSLAPKARELAGEQALMGQLQRQATDLRATYDNAEQALAIPCKACGKPHTADELETFRAHTRVLLTEKVEEAKKKAARIAQLEEVMTLATAELERLVKKVPDASALSVELKALNAQMSDIEFKKATIRSRVESSKNMKALAEKCRSDPNPEQSAISLCETQIDELTAKIGSLTSAKKSLDEEYEVAAAIAQVFSPAGVRAHILDTVTPFLNERTSEYLGTMSDGNISAVWSTLSKTAKGELREKFAIEVSHAKGGKSFGLISGGEKRKVRLACMMALQDLVASRATKPIDLFIADEIDEALDESGLERLMAILEEKARSKGTVLVISHNSLRDWVDDVTVVQKSAGLSGVHGALCHA